MCIDWYRIVCLMMLHIVRIGVGKTTAKYSFASSKLVGRVYYLVPKFKKIEIITSNACHMYFETLEIR